MPRRPGDPAVSRLDPEVLHEALPGADESARPTSTAPEELGVAKRRLERIIARAAAKGDLRTELVANRS